MKVRDLFADYLDASLRAKKRDARLAIVRQKEERDAYRRDLALLDKLLTRAKMSK